MWLSPAAAASAGTTPVIWGARRCTAATNSRRRSRYAVWTAAWWLSSHAVVAKICPLLLLVQPCAIEHDDAHAASCGLWILQNQTIMHVMWKPHSCTLTYNHMNKSISDYLTAWKFMMKTAQLSDMSS